jgi:hypothetical protein
MHHIVHSPKVSGRSARLLSMVIKATPCWFNLMLIFPTSTPPLKVPAFVNGGWKGGVTLDRLVQVKRPNLPGKPQNRRKVLSSQLLSDSPYSPCRPECQSCALSVDRSSRSVRTHLLCLNPSFRISRNTERCFRILTFWATEPSGRGGEEAVKEARRSAQGLAGQHAKPIAGAHYAKSAPLTHSVGALHEGNR